MKDLCYWELTGDPDNLRAEKYLLVIYDNNIAKMRVNLSLMGLDKKVDSYDDFRKYFPEPYYPYKYKEEKE